MVIFKNFLMGSYRLLTMKLEVISIEKAIILILII